MRISKKSANTQSPISFSKMMTFLLLPSPPRLRCLYHTLLPIDAAAADTNYYGAGRLSSPLSSAEPRQKQQQRMMSHCRISLHHCMSHHLHQPTTTKIMNHHHGHSFKKGCNPHANGEVLTSLQYFDRANNVVPDDNKLNAVPMATWHKLP